MTDKERKIITRINKYAETALKDIDPQHTPNGLQIKELMPIINEIAAEEGMTTEEMFIKYMDLQTEYKLEQQNKFNEEFMPVDE